MKNHLKLYGWMYFLAVVLIALALASCAGNPAADRMVNDYADARQDGKIDPAEIARLDRDASELDDALRAPPISTGGIGGPWVDLLEHAVTALAAGYGAHKYTMTVRDRLAAAKPPTAPTEPV